MHSIQQCHSASPDNAKRDTPLWYEPKLDTVIYEDGLGPDLGCNAPSLEVWKRLNDAKDIDALPNLLPDLDLGLLTREQWIFTLRHYDYRCAYCVRRPIQLWSWRPIGSKIYEDHCRIVTLNLEHMIPRSRGGAHSINNVIPACPLCNHNKGTQTVDEWLESWPSSMFLRFHAMETDREYAWRGGHGDYKDIPESEWEPHGKANYWFGARWFN